MPEMRADEYHRLYAVEQELWLLKGMRRIVVGALAAELGKPPDRPVILDAGCGTGALLDVLGGLGQVCGADLSPLATRYCRRNRGHPVARATMAALPFGDRTMDAVVCIDALGALPDPDDGRALAEMGRVLRPGGVLVLWAAAHPALRGPHDEATGMVQRHRRADLKTKVERAGLTVTRLSYANMLLFPGIALVRLLKRAFPSRADGQSDVAVPAKPLNRLLTGLMGLEARMLRHIDLPWGLSLVVVAKK